MSLQKYHNSNEHYGDAIVQLMMTHLEPTSPEQKEAARQELLQRGRELSRAAQGLTRDEVKGLDTACGHAGKHFEGKK